MGVSGGRGKRWDPEVAGSHRAKEAREGWESPTIEAIRLEGPALGEHGQQRLFPKDQLSDNTIPSPEAASAPRAWPQLKAAQDNWVPVQAKSTANERQTHLQIQLPSTVGCSAHRLSRISGSVIRVLVM